MKTLWPGKRASYLTLLSLQGHAECAYIYCYGALLLISFDDDDSQPVWWK